MTKRTLIALAVALLALATAGTALAAAPGATTGDATAVTSTSATVNGTVNPNKEATKYHFDYGTTTAYGKSTPEQGPVGGNGGKGASADLTQLAPSTTYHYRLVATNPSGTTPGADRTFTTLAPGQAPPGGNAVTIAAKPASIAFGRTTTISGQVTGSGNAGVQVTLGSQPLSSPAGTKFTKGATATTDASGNYSFVVPATENTRYQVEAKTKPPVTSPTVDVKVRFAVSFRLSDATPRRGQRVRFYGTVKPAHDGGTVLIQRRTRSGSFKTVARTTLRTSKTAGQSRYSKRLRIRSKGVYRVRVPHDATHATGTSRRRTIRVH
jgi:hypothetical protein